MCHTTRPPAVFTVLCTDRFTKLCVFTLTTGMASRFSTHDAPYQSVASDFYKHPKRAERNRLRPYGSSIAQNAQKIDLFCS